MPNAFWPDMGFGNRGTNVHQANRWNSNYYVRPYTGLDGQRGDSPQRARKTLKSALGLAQANANCRIIFMAEYDPGVTPSHTTDYYSTTLSWNVDNTHLTGVNSGQLYSQASRIANTSTLTDGTNIKPLVSVSANSCYWENINVYCGLNGSTAGVGACDVSGSHNVFRRCSFQGIGNASQSAIATGYSLKVSGQENLFEECVIGLDTIARTSTQSELIFAYNATTSAAASRNVFRNCIFKTYTTAGNNFFLSAAATTVDRENTFENCTFINYATGIASGATITQAFSLNASMGGMLLLKGCTFTGVTHVETTASGMVFRDNTNIANTSTVPTIT
jgi:hypothetical protein